MKAFQAIGLSEFQKQTQGKNLSSEVTELHFNNCGLSPDLLSSHFTQLSALSRLSLVDMKPALNEASLEAILSSLPSNGAKLRFLDVCDNKVTRFSDKTGPFPNLARLILCNNGIASLDDIGLNATRFPALRTVDVEDNKCEKDAQQRAWTLVPTLVVVNGKNKEGEPHHDKSDADDDDDDEDGAGNDDDDEGEGNGDMDEFVAEDEDDDDDNEGGDDNAGSDARESGQRRDREE